MLKIRSILKKHQYNRTEKQEKRMEEIVRKTTKKVVGEALEELKILTSTENEENFDKLKKKQNKQTIMTEEILEILVEHTKDKQNLENIIRREKKNKQELVNLVLMYQEYLDLISGHMEKINIDGDKWKEQLDLVYSDIEHNMSLSGMEKITGIDGTVNTLLHQVIEIEETKDPLKVETVKSVIVPGCIYQGRVERKAKIIAYIYSKINDNEGE